MTLPARQQRVLDQIETTLQSGDPGLKSMFASFTRMTSLEAMPTTEALYARLSRPAVLISVMVVALMSAVLLGLFAGPSSCAHAPARAAGHAVPAPICRSQTTADR